MESVWNLLQNPYDNAHLTFGMLLLYRGRLKIQILCRYCIESPVLRLFALKKLLSHSALILCTSFTKVS